MLDVDLVLDVAEVFPHEEGQIWWWESYERRTESSREELVLDLRKRLDIQRDKNAQL